MDRSAKALESFCEDDEAWVDSWTVSAVGRGWGAAMPGFSQETIGLTDRRLLWLEENLETVPLADVTAVTNDSVDHENAPGMVRAGGVAFVLGAIGSAVLLFVLEVGLTIGSLPVVVGLGLFGLSIVFARAREQSGTRMTHQRLRIETDDAVVIVWGDEADVAALEDAIRERSAAERSAA